MSLSGDGNYCGCPVSRQTRVGAVVVDVVKREIVSKAGRTRALSNCAKTVDDRVVHVDMQVVNPPPWNLATSDRATQISSCGSQVDTDCADRHGLEDAMTARLVKNNGRAV